MRRSQHLHTLALLSLVASAAVLACAGPATQLRTGEAIHYPATRALEQVDDYHGTLVADPYRWLEDLDSEDTADWVARQNELTFDYLERIPQRGAIRDRLAELWNYERFGLPSERGQRVFYTRNDGLQNQSVLWVQEGPGSEPRVLLDPNTLSEDGTVALSGTAVSDDGRWLAYSLSQGGSDWKEWRVREVARGRDTGDIVSWCKFGGVSWSHDNAGFYYTRFPEPPPGAALEAVNTDNRVFYHRLGDPQEADRLVYERPDHPKWGFGPTVTDDGRWLVLSISEGTDRRNRIYYQDLQVGGPIVPLLDEFDASYTLVGSRGSTFYFLTSNAAPRNRVVAIDLERPEPGAWREVIPESADLLRSVQLLDGALVCHWMHDAHSRVAVHDLAGGHRYDVELPGLGTLSGPSGRWNDPDAWYSFSSFTQPDTIFHLDIASGRSEVYRRPQIELGAQEFETKQVWFTSRDGTRVPMFVVHRTGLELDGTNPAYLYGYGGFNISMTPRFSVSNLVWLEMGGVFAMPNLRGGGEYGKAWHEAGTVHDKQNVFDDFIAAAEWLVDEGYTAPERLAIGGGSNGGLLVGACMTQRPELFGAALPAVGVMDMLRYHKFTIGWAWVSDYGSSDDPEQFRTLLAYSPVHNLRPGRQYPATLVTTGDHDDRVVPSHSFKFAAALQKAQAGPAPVLIRVETRAGHGAGKPMSKRIEEQADRWAFLVRELGAAPSAGWLGG